MAMRRVRWSNVEEDDEMGNLNSGRSEERALDHGAWSMEQLARAKPRYRTVSGWRLGPTTLQKFDKRITGSNKVQCSHDYYDLLVAWQCLISFFHDGPKTRWPLQGSALLRWAWCGQISPALHQSSRLAGSSREKEDGANISHSPLLPTRPLARLHSNT